MSKNNSLYHYYLPVLRKILDPNDLTKTIYEQVGKNKKQISFKKKSELAEWSNEVGSEFTKLLKLVPKKKIRLDSEKVPIFAPANLEPDISSSRKAHFQQLQRGALSLSFIPTGGKLREKDTDQSIAGDKIKLFVNVDFLSKIPLFNAVDMLTPIIINLIAGSKGNMGRLTLMSSSVPEIVDFVKNSVAPTLLKDSGWRMNKKVVLDITPLVKSRKDKVFYDHKSIVKRLVSSLRLYFTNKNNVNKPLPDVVIKYANGKTQKLNVNFNNIKYIIDQIYMSMNKPQKVDEYAEYLIDENGDYMTDYEIIIHSSNTVVKQPKSSTRPRRKGGWLDVILSKEFCKNNSETVVSFIENTLGIASYKTMEDVIHKSCLAFAMLNDSHAKTLLTEDDIIWICNSASTTLFNLESTQIDKKVLPFLSSVKCINIRHLTTKNNKSSGSSSIKMDYRGDKNSKENERLHICCVDGHYFPYISDLPFQIKDIIPNIMIDRNFKNSSIRLVIELLNLRNTGYLGIRKYTVNELLKFDVTSYNKAVTTKLEAEYGINLKAKDLIPGIDLSKHYQETKAFNPLYYQYKFDAGLMFDTETAPTDAGIQTFYQGVAVGLPAYNKSHIDLSDILIKGELSTKNFIDELVGTVHSELLKRSIRKFKTQKEKEADNISIRKGLKDKSITEKEFYDTHIYEMNKQPDHFHVSLSALNVTYDYQFLANHACRVEKHHMMHSNLVTATYVFRVPSSYSTEKKKQYLHITFIDEWRQIQSSLDKAASNLGIKDSSSVTKTEFPYHCMDVTNYPERCDPGSYHPLSALMKREDWTPDFNWKNFLENNKEFYHPTLKTHFNISGASLKYCINDCKVAANIFTAYNKFIQTIDANINPELSNKVPMDLYNHLSMTSIAMEFVKRHGGLEGVELENSVMSNGYLSRFLNGGRVTGSCDGDELIKDGNFRGGRNIKGKHLRYIDVSSLYPAALLLLPGLPTGIPTAIFNNKPNHSSLSPTSIFTNGESSFTELYKNYLKGRRQPFFGLTLRYSPSSDRKIKRFYKPNLPVTSSYSQSQLMMKKVWSNDITNDSPRYVSNYTLSSFVAIHRISPSIYSVKDDLDYIHAWRDFIPEEIERLETKLFKALDTCGFVWDEGIFYLADSPPNKGMRDVVSSLYKIRTEIPALSEMAKLAMNSVMGRLTMKLNDYEEKAMTYKKLNDKISGSYDSIISHHPMMSNDLSGFIEKKESWMHLVKVRTRDHPKVRSFALSIIYSVSKCYMDQIADCCGGIIYYSDTDSALIDDESFIRLGIEGKRRGLGIPKDVGGLGRGVIIPPLGTKGIGTIHSDVSSDEDVYVTDASIQGRKSYCLLLSNGEVKYSLKGIPNHAVLYKSMKCFLTRDEFQKRRKDVSDGGGEFKMTSAEKSKAIFSLYENLLSVKEDGVEFNLLHHLTNRFKTYMRRQKTGSFHIIGKFSRTLKFC